LSIAFRVEKNYKIDILATDYYAVYEKYKIANTHIQTKAETSLVESKNSLLRLNLTRLNRKSRRHSKCIEMLKHSINLLINKDILLPIYGYRANVKPFFDRSCYRIIRCEVSRFRYFNFNNFISVSVNSQPYVQFVEFFL